MFIPRAAASSVAGRAVHIKIFPRPRNIAESREVLRVLERYGEVVMYKHLKYEPEAPAANSALAIFRHEEGANKILQASPLTVSFEKSGDRGVKEYGLEAPHNDGSVGEETEGLIPLRKKGQGIQEGKEATTYLRSSISSTAEPGPLFSSLSPAAHPSTTVPPDSPIPSAFTTPTVQNTLDHTPSLPPATSSSTTDSSSRPSETQLHISPSALNHQAYIARQGYYASFKIKDTIASQDIVPRALLPGLADVDMRKGEVPLRMRNNRASKNRNKVPRLRELLEEGFVRERVNEEKRRI